MSGRTSYYAGVSAEDQVAQFYDRSGRQVVARRWRGPGGEIDLIARDGTEVIFIEVKQARSHAIAAERVTPRQMARIYASAECFIGKEPAGSLTPVRFDVALVDGTGRIKVLENAFAA
ncbi:MAG: YraN family protein [Pseudotabrizicola sp.]|uniref:YraN family protein n=1 Tax=Pseudotabrizicola sp. TaxID=2939647 RepID=UPI00271928F9|nr:YraN family protein [Pseudotabrizicola sp.]MDO9641428.1 YraN family protein [Pseudotabrizicola sp.]